MTRNLVALIALTLSVLITYAVISLERVTGDATASTQGVLVFPDLATDLDAVTSMEVRRAAGAFTLARSPQGWVNLGVGGYPAIDARMDAAIAGLAALRRVAPRTARAPLYSKLGVEDVSSSSTSTRLIVKHASGATLADIIVGRPQRGGTGRKRPGVYVRLPGESTAWLADGVLDVRDDAPEWCERRLVDIAPDAVQAITVLHPDGERIELRRDASPAMALAPNALTLVDLPPGTAVRHRFQIQYLAGVFDALTMLNARQASATDSAAATGSQITVTSRNGVRVRLREVASAEANRIWAVLDAESSADASSAGAREAMRLRAAMTGWAFLLPQAVTERLRIRLEDIVGATAN